MEHIQVLKQVLKCEKCGMAYEIRWESGIEKMLRKVHGLVVCVGCENVVTSRGFDKFMKSCVE